jgi:hypothetical protein
LDNFFFLDGLEDARALSLIERNFRNIVQAHLKKFFEAKRTYWRKRAIIRFVKFGEENTQGLRSFSNLDPGGTQASSHPTRGLPLPDKHDQRQSLGRR